MELKNFAVLTGSFVKIEDGKISFTPPKNSTVKEKIVDDFEAPAAKWPVTRLRSDTSFSSGTIEFKLKASVAETGILLIFKTDGEPIVCGVSKTLDTFVISNNELKGAPLAKSGSLKNYQIGNELLFKIDVVGSTIQLSVNNVLLCEANATIRESPIEFRINSLGKFELYDIVVHKRKPKIFIVMQFSKEYNELYEDVISPVSAEFGYECVRADEFYTSTPILKDIIDNILQSVAIIAEITPDNPNVFYEIGYSHAIGKPTILLCDKKREKLPFDLSSFRTLFYENTIAGKKKVESSLRKYLQNI